jgi:hypothetical protein
MIQRIVGKVHLDTLDSNWVLGIPASPAIVPAPYAGRVSAHIISVVPICAGPDVVAAGIGSENHPQLKVERRASKHGVVKPLVKVEVCVDSRIVGEKNGQGAQRAESKREELHHDVVSVPEPMESEDGE